MEIKTRDALLEWVPFVMALVIFGPAVWYMSFIFLLVFGK